MAVVLSVPGGGRSEAGSGSKLRRVATHGRAERGGDSSRGRVGVLDNDSGFVQVLSKRLDAAGVGHHVVALPASQDALVAMRLSALIVDPVVLGPAPLDSLEALCRRMPRLPVMICTAPAAVAQRVRGLRLGADDWITKPCHPEEVVARLEAVMRRRTLAEPRGQQAVVKTGGLIVRADLYQAFAGDDSADLTRREFELIQLLVGHEGQVMPREEIYERVWGYAMAHGDRSVDVFVRKLRQKLEKVSPDWRYIHTHFGVGYRFAPESARLAAPTPAQSFAANDGTTLATA